MHKRFLQDPAHLAELGRAIDEIYSAYLSDEKVKVKLDRYKSLVSPWIAKVPDSTFLPVLSSSPASEWDAAVPSCDQEVQIGGVLRDFQQVYPHLVCTSIHDDLLWVTKPKFPGSFLLTTKNYHIADYNFFYADVRKNAQDRVKAFLGNQ